MLRKKKMVNQRSLGKLPTIVASSDTPQRRTHQEGSGGLFMESKKRERTTDFIQRNKQEVQKKTPIHEKRTPIGSKKGVRATPGKNSKYRPILKDRDQKMKTNKEIRGNNDNKKEEDPYKNSTIDKDKKKSNSMKSNISKVDSNKESSHPINIETTSKQELDGGLKKELSQEKPKEEPKEEFAFEGDESVHDQDQQNPINELSVKEDHGKQ